MKGSFVLEDRPEIDRSPEEGMTDCRGVVSLRDPIGKQPVNTWLLGLSLSSVHQM